MIRFKSLGGSTEQPITIYQTRVRSTLEFAAPVFTSGLTKEQSRQIEMVQKKAFAIILGKNYTSYESALDFLEQERLDLRRTNISYSFAVECTQSEQHKSMFPLNPNVRLNMRYKKPFMEFKSNTSRYYSSPIPYLAKKSSSTN